MEVVLLRQIVCAVILCIAYDTAICSECLFPCKHCTLDINTTCTECVEGFYLGYTDDIYCQSGWDRNSGTNDCYRMERKRLSWHNARHYCTNLTDGRGATLTSIRSSQEQHYLSELMNWRGQDYWVGAHDNVEEDSWEWVDRSPWWSDIRWEPGTPDDNEKGEDCCMITSTSDGHVGVLSDAPCKEEKPFICRKKGSVCNECSDRNTGCLTCKSAGSSWTVDCTSCMEGYFLSFIRKATGNCKKCDKGCQTCEWKNGTVNCTSCMDNYVLTFEENEAGKCKDCSESSGGCKTCEWNNGTVYCTSCNTEYASSSDENKTVVCKSCPKSCSICETETKCTKCNSGHYIIRTDDKTAKCKACSIGCSRCEANGGCPSCYKGYEHFINYCLTKTEYYLVCVAIVLSSVAAILCTMICGRKDLHAFLRSRIAIPPTEGHNTWMDIIFCAVRLLSWITVVLPFAFGVYRIYQRLRNCRGSAVQPTEDNSVEKSETEQGTRRQSVEMAIFNENGETSDVHIGGSLYYNTKKMIGSGSYGVVFEGRSGLHKNKQLAIKKVECSSKENAKDVLLINKEIKTLETLATTAENTHIIHFIDSYIKGNTVYLAFELAIGTLVDYVSPSNASWQLSLNVDDVIRGIVAGLNYTHTKSIVHRDLKPKNIFIVDHNGLKAVIGDFGQAKAMTGNTFTSAGTIGSFGFIAPEVWKAMSDTAKLSLGTTCNKSSDIFSLGLVAYYTISLGKHPFGNIMTAQVSIANGDPPTFNKISFAYIDMLECMLNSNPDKRLTIDKVSSHPALWTSDTIIRYFVIKSDEFEGKIKAGSLKKNLLEDPQLIPNGNWMNQLPGNMQTYLQSYTLPNRTSPMYSGKENEVRFLLRAVRNTNGHYQNYPQNTQAEMGDYPEGHVTLWLKVCPKLLMHVFDKLGH